MPTSNRDLAANVRRGSLDPATVLAATERALERADSGPDPVSAFLSVRTGTDDRNGPPTGPLAGVPIAVKDNIATIDFPTTCGSRILEGYRSPFDATAVRRLREAGAVILGKTNLDEFGMGSSTEHSAYGPTRNPLDRSRVPGGSSGGSAAAVAAGIVRGALGSETGGSVRQPSAFCGVVGIKPTYGRVSRYGLVAYASSLDQIGVIGRSVDDAAILLQVIAGHDALDSTSADRPVPDYCAPPSSLEGVVIGVPQEYFPDSLHPGVSSVCRSALHALEGLGAEVREVSLPTTPYAVPTYYILAPAEASSNLARYDGVRYGVRYPGVADVKELYDRTRALFGPEVKRRIMLGTYVLSAGYYDAYYGRAQRVRRLISHDFTNVFASGVDALFTPTTPTPAFRLGERTDDPYEMYLSDVFTVTANLAGVPALSLPIGDVDGLPVGGQLMGPPWSEGSLLRIATALESSLASSGSSHVMPRHASDQND
ncbi:MAG: Asp-tRNA(Asn)/Glu-tRNA(Gln) amidotransferase subunit GatA [Gemmatimonas sp.]|nr:Asp-tRNA(Asn)/Glu-tRNA(Gln) amidotransferase subunit GatA [Gemmatimonas sp.]